ncbi:PAS domain-containing protein [Flavobacterium rivuli]|nr:PAS domain-containing protein [Flavobacterium rivuli]
MGDDNKDINSMMCLDIYLSSLSDAEYSKIAQKIKSKRVFPVTSWDISANFLQKNNPVTTQENDRQQLNLFSKKFKWKLDLNSIMPSRYEAIIITDIKQEIYWVNQGFAAMTGYSAEHAVGRKPDFLQGNKTLPEVRKNIREHLQHLKPIACTIINYRKNGDEYVCEVKIIPISNDKNIVTHFLAFEREAV